MNVQSLHVIEGGRGTASARRVHHAVYNSLTDFRAGSHPDPLFLVPPGTDTQVAASEAMSLGIPHHAHVLMRTSGSTTGTGKIVALSWPNLIASATGTAQWFSGSGAWLADLPYHHIAGFQTIVRSVLAGFEPLTTNVSDPAAVATVLAATAAKTVYFSLVPTQLARIVESNALIDAFQDTVFLVGGQRISDELLARARNAGLAVSTSYGMTETCGGCVYDGTPIGNAHIHFDPTGRIAIKGDMVALGYLGGVEPESWLDTDPRTHVTRDIGKFTGTRLQILGRMDDAITTGGLTIMPALIEAEITRITGSSNVVVGIPHSTWGEAAIAVVAHTINETTVRDALKTSLGPGWAPTRVLSLAELGDEWPLKDSGKIDRTALAEKVRVYLHG